MLADFLRCRDMNLPVFHMHLTPCNEEVPRHYPAVFPSKLHFYIIYNHFGIQDIDIK